ncbi:hypothetical protein QYF36_007508 [Acer negundo]|nr:hypothetical protein QYF36_007508 [Acer negundo]
MTVVHNCRPLPVDVTNYNDHPLEPVNAVTSSVFKQQHRNKFSIFRRNWLLYGDDFRELSSCWDCANELVS